MDGQPLHGEPVERPDQDRAERFAQFVHAQRIKEQEYQDRCRQLGAHIVFELSFDEKTQRFSTFWTSEPNDGSIARRIEDGSNVVWSSFFQENRPGRPTVCLIERRIGQESKGSEAAAATILDANHSGPDANKLFANWKSCNRYGLWLQAAQTVTRIMGLAPIYIGNDRFVTGFELLCERFFPTQLPEKIMHPEYNVMSWICLATAYRGHLWRPRIEHLRFIQRVVAEVALVRIREPVPDKMSTELLKLSELNAIRTMRYDDGDTEMSSALDGFGSERKEPASKPPSDGSDNKEAALLAGMWLRPLTHKDNDVDSIQMRKWMRVWAIRFMENTDEHNNLFPRHDLLVKFWSSTVRAARDLEAKMGGSGAFHKACCSFDDASWFVLGIDLATNPEMVDSILLENPHLYKTILEILSKSFDLGRDDDDAVDHDAAENSNGLDDCADREIRLHFPYLSDYGRAENEMESQAPDESKTAAVTESKRGKGTGKGTGKRGRPRGSSAPSSGRDKAPKTHLSSFKSKAAVLERTRKSEAELKRATSESASVLDRHYQQQMRQTPTPFAMSAASSRTASSASNAPFGTSAVRILRQVLSQFVFQHRTKKSLSDGDRMYWPIVDTTPVPAMPLLSSVASKIHHEIDRFVCTTIRNQMNAVASIMTSDGKNSAELDAMSRALAGEPKGGQDSMSSTAQRALCVPWESCGISARQHLAAAIADMLRMHVTIRLVKRIGGGGTPSPLDPQGGLAAPLDPRPEKKQSEKGGGDGTGGGSDTEGVVEEEAGTEAETKGTQEDSVVKKPQKKRSKQTVHSEFSLFYDNEHASFGIVKHATTKKEASAATNMVSGRFTWQHIASLVAELHGWAPCSDWVKRCNEGVVGTSSKDNVLEHGVAFSSDAKSETVSERVSEHHMFDGKTDQRSVSAAFIMETLYPQWRRLFQGPSACAASKHMFNSQDIGGQIPVVRCPSDLGFCKELFDDTVGLSMGRPNMWKHELLKLVEIYIQRTMSLVLCSSDRTEFRYQFAWNREFGFTLGRGGSWSGGNGSGASLRSLQVRLSPTSGWTIHCAETSKQLTFPSQWTLPSESQCVQFWGLEPPKPVAWPAASSVSDTGAPADMLQVLKRLERPESILERKGAKLAVSDVRPRPQTVLYFEQVHDAQFFASSVPSPSATSPSSTDRFQCTVYSHQYLQNVAQTLSRFCNSDANAIKMWTRCLTVSATRSMAVAPTTQTTVQSRKLVLVPNLTEPINRQCMIVLCMSGLVEYKTVKAVSTTAAASATETKASTAPSVPTIPVESTFCIAQMASKWALILLSAQLSDLCESLEQEVELKRTQRSVIDELETKDGIAAEQQRPSSSILCPASFVDKFVWLPLFSVRVDRERSLIGHACDSLRRKLEAIADGTTSVVRFANGSDNGPHRLAAQASDNDARILCAGLMSCHDIMRPVSGNLLYEWRVCPGVPVQCLTQLVKRLSDWSSMCKIADPSKIHAERVRLDRCPQILPGFDETQFVVQRASTPTVVSMVAMSPSPDADSQAETPTQTLPLFDQGDLRSASPPLLSSQTSQSVIRKPAAPLRDMLDKHGFVPFRGSPQDLRAMTWVKVLSTLFPEQAKTVCGLAIEKRCQFLAQTIARLNRIKARLHAAADGDTTAEQGSMVQECEGLAAVYTCLRVSIGILFLDSAYSLDRSSINCVTALIESELVRSGSIVLPCPLGTPRRTEMVTLIAAGLADSEKTVVRRSTLVVCKASSMHLWTQEIRGRYRNLVSYYVFRPLDCEEWMPSRDGKLPGRLERSNLVHDSVEKLNKYDVVLVTFTQLEQMFARRDALLRSVEWLRVIVDDAETVRDHETTFFESIYPLQARYRHCVLKSSVALAEPGSSLCVALARILRAPLMMHGAWVRFHSDTLWFSQVARLCNLLSVRPSVGAATSSSSSSLASCTITEVRDALRQSEFETELLREFARHIGPVRDRAVKTIGDCDQQKLTTAYVTMLGNKRDKDVLKCQVFSVLDRQIVTPFAMLLLPSKMSPVLQMDGIKDILQRLARGSGDDGDNGSDSDVDGWDVLCDMFKYCRDASDGTVDLSDAETFDFFKTLVSRRPTLLNSPRFQYIHTLAKTVAETRPPCKSDSKIDRNRSLLENKTFLANFTAEVARVSAKPSGALKDLLLDACIRMYRGDSVSLSDTDIQKDVLGMLMTKMSSSNTCKTIGREREHEDALNAFIELVFGGLVAVTHESYLDWLSNRFFKDASLRKKKSASASATTAVAAAASKTKTVGAEEDAKKEQEPEEKGSGKRGRGGRGGRGTRGRGRGRGRGGSGGAGADGKPVSDDFGTTFSVKSARGRGRGKSGLPGSLKNHARAAKASLLAVRKLTETRSASGAGGASSAGSATPVTMQKELEMQTKATEILRRTQTCMSDTDLYMLSSFEDMCPNWKDGQCLDFSKYIVLLLTDMRRDIQESAIDLGVRRNAIKREGLKLERSQSLIGTTGLGLERKMSGLGQSLSLQPEDAVASTSQVGSWLKSTTGKNGETALAAHMEASTKAIHQMMLNFEFKWVATPKLVDFVKRTLGGGGPVAPLDPPGGRPVPLDPPGGKGGTQSPLFNEKMVVWCTGSNMARLASIPVGIFCKRLGRGFVEMDMRKVALSGSCNAADLPALVRELKAINWIVSASASYADDVLVPWQATFDVSVAMSAINITVPKAKKAKKTTAKEAKKTTAKGKGKEGKQAVAETPVVVEDEAERIAEAGLRHTHGDRVMSLVYATELVLARSPSTMVLLTTYAAARNGICLGHLVQHSYHLDASSSWPVSSVAQADACLKRPCTFVATRALPGPIRSYQPSITDGKEKPLEPEFVPEKARPFTQLWNVLQASMADVSEFQPTWPPPPPPAPEPPKKAKTEKKATKKGKDATESKRRKKQDKNEGTKEPKETKETKETKESDAETAKDSECGEAGQEKDARRGTKRKRSEGDDSDQVVSMDEDSDREQKPSPKKKPGRPKKKARKSDD